MIPGRSNLVDIDATLVHETDRAVLLDTGSARAWVPKSVVEDNGDGTWTLPEPMAVEKGLV